MKKLLAVASLFLAFNLLPIIAVTQVSAQVCTEQGGTENCDPLNETCQGAAAASPICDRDKNSNPISGSNGILLRATSIISYVVGIVCVIIIVVGAIRYIVSQGDSTTVKSVKNQIIYALIGLIVTIAARSIIIFVINRI